MEYVPEIIAVLTFGLIMMVGWLVAELWDAIEKVEAIREKEALLPKHTNE